MSATEMVTWWTPLGWETDIEPPAYAAFRASRGYDSDRAAAGYTLHMPAFPASEEYSAAGTLAVWRHADHLWVTIWDRDAETCVFFVARPQIPAFRATELPRLMQAMAAVWQAEELRVIRRAMVAFVRHGHGPDTVDETGSQDRDEREIERRIWEGRVRTAAEKEGDR